MTDYRIRVETEITGGSLPHKKGDKIQLVDEILHPKFGRICYLSPDEVGIFLHFAELYLPKAAIEKEAVFKDLKNIKTPEGIAKEISNEKKTFRYFEYSAVVIILLYTALEAFSNKLIPKDYRYNITLRGGRIIELDKFGIERNFNTFDKLSTILPSALTKPSPKGISEWRELVQLRRIRNKLIHLGSKNSYAATNNYKSVYNDLFLVDLNKILFSIKIIFNHFGENKYINYQE